MRSQRKLTWWAPARMTSEGEAVVLAPAQAYEVPTWTRRRAIRMVGPQLAVVLRLKPGQPALKTGQRVRYSGGPWPLRTVLVEVLS